MSIKWRGIQKAEGGMMYRASPEPYKYCLKCQKVNGLWVVTKHLHVGGYAGYDANGVAISSGHKTATAAKASVTA